MGKYNEGILGFFRGKVGRVIGSVVRGVHYMKGLGDIRTDNPTEAQLRQRTKFAVMGSFLRPLIKVVKLGFPAQKNEASSTSQAMSINLKNAITGIAPDFEVDYPNLKISKGYLDRTDDGGMTTLPGAKLKFDWKITAGAAPTDMVTLLAYSPEIDRYVVLMDAAPRSALNFTLQLPAAFLGTLTHGWLFFSNGKESSDTVYTTAQTII